MCLARCRSISRKARSNGGREVALQDVSVEGVDCSGPIRPERGGEPADGAGFGHMGVHQAGSGGSHQPAYSDHGGDVGMRPDRPGEGNPPDGYCRISQLAFGWQRAPGRQNRREFIAQRPRQQQRLPGRPPDVEPGHHSKDRGTHHFSLCRNRSRVSSVQRVCPWSAAAVSCSARKASTAVGSRWARTRALEDPRVPRR